ncbi:hypothetical protein SAMN02949497_2431 [Methylomagnum ishizawai]|uniref:Uncharacterized protein n=1 Tax=Methylomagnum ishizawai TaxID=1760988 RepID=A0A1Y6CXS6_9GAMM|nr:hypothetical protein [Methylomagnum ishizawai]SMF95086.1 hypothetical protein SAMN02949497_2431 [Methylomagnum ishizawai]
MAKRPVFIPVFKQDHLVDEIQTDFEWNPGFSVSQKKKNVAALHDAAKRKGFFPLLEVSTKSEELLGQRLSAFSLKIKSNIGEISVEAAFQGSKVFENGGPYTDIYTKESREAKRDERLKQSGKLIKFNYFGQEWPLIPKTAFYDWLFLTALQPHQEYLKRLFKYKGFTDIEFNPEKSINCQARTCALLVSLLKLDLMDKALATQDSFISFVLADSLKQSHSTDIRQIRIL